MYWKDRYKEIHLECLKERLSRSYGLRKIRRRVLFFFLNGKRPWHGGGPVKFNRMKMKETIICTQHHPENS